MSTIKEFFNQSEANDPMSYFNSLTNREIVHLRILENDSHTRVDSSAKLKHLIKVFEQHRNRLVDITKVMNDFTKWQDHQLHDQLRTLTNTNNVRHFNQTTNGEVLDRNNQAK